MAFCPVRLPALTLSAVLGLASCSNSSEVTAPANRISFNNFEAIDGWGETFPSLTNVQAHSGHYAIKVDQGVDYSLGYTNLLGRASSTKFTKLVVHGWVYAAGPNATAALVVQVTVPEKNNRQLFWQAADLLQEATKIKEWREFRHEFTLPDSVDAGHQLKVYMWRRGGEQPTYLDDLDILRGE